MIKTGVYRIRNSVNQHCYYGSTKNAFIVRKNAHFSLLRRGDHHSEALQRAFQKHGESAFVFEVVERISDLNKVGEREQHYLNKTPEYNCSYFVNSGGAPQSLNREQCLAAISRVAEAEPLGEVAAYFGIDPTVLYRILDGKTYGQFGIDKHLISQAKSMVRKSADEARISNARAMRSVSDVNVKKIRWLRTKTRKVKLIAESLGISAGVTSQIANGRSYKDVQGMVSDQKALDWILSR